MGDKSSSYIWLLFENPPCYEDSIFSRALCYRIAHDILIEMPFALQSSTQDARTP